MRSDSNSNSIVEKNNALGNELKQKVIDLNFCLNNSSVLISQDISKKIICILNKANVRMEGWGKDMAKTFNHLVVEILEKESSLGIDDQNELIRKLTFGAAHVYFMGYNNVVYKLYEDKQVFKDGRIRKRNMIYSLAEKFRFNEEKKRAMERGLREELGLKDNIDIYYLKTEEEKNAKSMSFPGLKSDFIVHHFDVFLKEDQFKVQGYIEKQDDKTTYFKWKVI